MTQHSTEKSQQVAARIAGSALLLIIVSGVVGTVIRDACNRPDLAKNLSQKAS